MLLNALSILKFFREILLASRTAIESVIDIAKDIIQEIGQLSSLLSTAKVDAENVPELGQTHSKSFQPKLVDSCCAALSGFNDYGCLPWKPEFDYMDTANYEPKEEAKFEYSWQWAYQDRFKEKGILGLLGCGFDPGVTSIFTAYAAKHYFDEIHYLDIVDCNGGDHGKAFATNFNPEINIREITQKGRFYENGKWIETEPHEICKTLNYPGIGPKNSYLIYHEELESLVKNYPTIKKSSLLDDIWR